jgi:uncharacterized protein YaiI (UPF0178 family)
MKTWVDADACPVVVKDILFRAVALPPPGFSQRDKQAFANNLDRFLTKHAQSG